MKLTTLLLSCGLAFSWSAYAADYHLDSVEGNDAGDGSRVNPWRTIDRANAVEFQPGDRLLFRGGQSFSGNLVLNSKDAGTPHNPVTVGSYGEGHAQILAGKGTGVLVENAGGVIVEKLRISGSNREENIGSGVRFVNTLEGGVKLEFVRIRDVECSGFGSDPNGQLNRWGVLEDFGQGIFVGGRPADRSKSGYRDVLIERSVCFDNAYYGIQVSGAWDPDSPKYANYNVQILRCSAHHNTGDPRLLATHSGNGILISDVADGFVDQCLAWENGALCAAPGGGPVGIWAAHATRIVIQRCESWRNRTAGLDGAGFDFDGGVTDSVMQYNYAHENEGAGFLLYSYGGSPHRYARNVVRFNVSVDDGRKNGYGGISIGNYGGVWDNLDVYQNTVVTSATAGGASGASCLYIMRYSEAANVRIFNNLLVARGGAPVVNAHAHPGLTIVGNAYWAVDAPVNFVYEGQQFASLEEWRTGAKQEMWDGSGTGFVGDPLVSMPLEPPTVANTKRLRDIEAYRLLPGSPLLGAALNIAQTPLSLPLGEHDFYGQPLEAKALAIGAAQGQAVLVMAEADEPEKPAEN